MRVDEPVSIGLKSNTACVACLQLQRASSEKSSGRIVHTLTWLLILTQSNQQRTASVTRSAASPLTRASLEELGRRPHFSFCPRRVHAHPPSRVVRTLPPHR